MAECAIRVHPVDLANLAIRIFLQKRPHGHPYGNPLLQQGNASSPDIGVDPGLSCDSTAQGDEGHQAAHRRARRGDGHAECSRATITRHYGEGVEIGYGRSHCAPTPYQPKA